MPWLITEPAPGAEVKFRRPERKSAFDRFRLEATRPAVSITEPAPKTMPFGLIRKTRPLDCSVPRIEDGFCVVTRLRTAEEPDCWTNLVISPAPIEKLCQLMIALGELVTWSRLPACRNAALPLTTVGTVGLAYAESEKQAATARASGLTAEPCRLLCVGAPLS